MLEVHIAKNRGNFDMRLEFRLTDCGVTVIFGPSGSGKSTLINCIAGLETPDSGRIRYNQTTYFDADSGVNLPPEKRGLGYVFQDSRLFPHLSVRENLAFGLRFNRNKISDISPSLSEVADLLDIAPLLARSPATLSGGEKQRVSIGRALLCRPYLLLMDEPLSSLDLSLKQGLLEYMLRIPRQWHVPVLYVTHAPEEALALGNRMLLLHHGRIEADGDVAATLRIAHDKGLLPQLTRSFPGDIHETSQSA